MITKTEFKDLKCVSCENLTADLIISSDEVRCNHCGQVFPIVNNIPVVINESESVFSFSDFVNEKNLFFDISTKGKAITTISKLMPSIGGNNLGKKNFALLENILRNKNKSGSKPRVLVIGGSIVGDGMTDFVKSSYLDLVEGDVSFGPQTKIIFDSHSIPYKDGSFDCVIVQAVLEHVIDPIKCVAEIYRILKIGGVVYAETPFMQQVHGGPYDFTRYTRSGHRRLFQHFKEIKAGSTAGSGTALAWSYQYFLLALFGYNHTMRLCVKIFARLTGFWIKYLDYLTRYNARDVDGASGFFFIGEKNSQSLTDREIINYYSL
jgi:SAM-dependent methyltransferase/uncharacterized protein YbaR (Trm112 family)